MQYKVSLGRCCIASSLVPRPPLIAKGSKHCTGTDGSQTIDRSTDEAPRARNLRDRLHTMAPSFILITQPSSNDQWAVTARRHTVALAWALHWHWLGLCTGTGLGYARVAAVHWPGQQSASRVTSDSKCYCSVVSKQKNTCTDTHVHEPAIGGRLHIFGTSGPHPTASEAGMLVLGMVRTVVITSHMGSKVVAHAMGCQAPRLDGQEQLLYVMRPPKLVYKRSDKVVCISQSAHTFNKIGITMAVISPPRWLWYNLIAGYVFSCTWACTGGSDRLTKESKGWRCRGGKARQQL